MQVVLYIRDTGADIFTWHSKGQVEHRWMVWEQLPGYASQLPKHARISMVLDLVDEDLQVEYMPSLLPWEKQALQKRLKTKWQQKGVLSQRFIWTGQKQKNDSGRNEELVITALLYPFKPLQNLIAQLIEQNSLLVGIYSAAFLLKRFFEKEVARQLKLKRAQKLAPIMLIARMTPRHYRQCFFYQGQLRLTRMVELENKPYTEQQIIEFLATEAKLATRFIYNQKILPFGAAFNFVILDHMDGENQQAHWEAFDQVGSVISNKWNPAQNFFDVLNIIDQVSMPSDDLCFGHALLADQLFSSWFASFYQYDYIAKINALRALRSGLYLSAGALTLAALFSLINVGLQTNFWQKKAQLYQTNIQALSIHRKQLTDQVSDRILADDMQSTVEFSRDLKALISARPYGLDFELIAHSLAQHPNVKLQALSWQPKNKTDDTLVSFRLRAWVTGFNSEYKTMTEVLNAFVSDLESQPAVKKLDLVQKPFNENPSQALNITPTSSMSAVPFVIEGEVEIPKMDSERAKP